MPKALYSERYQRFRTLLIERRKDAGLTQAALAEMLSKPQSYVAKFREEFEEHIKLGRCPLKDGD